MPGAKKVFAHNKEVEKIIATGDEHYFLMSAENLANDHCARKGVKSVEITREEAENESVSEDLTDTVKDSKPAATQTAKKKPGRPKKKTATNTEAPEVTNTEAPEIN